VDLSEVAARYALGRVPAEEAFAVAHDVLNRGIYSESFGLLIYERSEWPEIRLLFERGLAELGAPIPDRPGAIHRLAAALARRVLDGELSPLEGAKAIRSAFHHQPEAGESIRSIAALVGEWEDDMAHRPEYEAAILDEIKKLASA
jgi:hypothetical protein